MEQPCLQISLPRKDAEALPAPDESPVRYLTATGHASGHPGIDKGGAPTGHASPQKLPGALR